MFFSIITIALSLVVNASLHDSFKQPLRTAHSGVKRSTLRKLNSRNQIRAGLEATVKCVTEITWSLCAGESCTFMGPVAAGTKCFNDAMVSASQIPTASTTTSSIEPAAPSITLAPLSASTIDDCGVDSTDSTLDSSSSASVSVQTRSASITAVVQAAQPTPSSAAAPAPSPIVSISIPAVPSGLSTIGDGVAITGGQGTFYNQEGGIGACGHSYSDSDFIVAISLVRYGTGSNNAPDCGRKVTVTNVANGKQVNAIVADACPGCIFNSLDLSVAAFNQIADPATGRIDIRWVFNN